jgi:hypothetical protein
MSKTATKAGEWLTSQDTQKRLRISSCELMHLRVVGRLRFRKHGNAFRYDPDDVRRIEAVGKQTVPR